MALFRRDHDDLRARVVRLMEEDQAARARMSQRAVDQVLATAWQLEKELFPLAADGDVRVAAGLMDVARICLMYQLAARDWHGAIASGAAMSLAKTRIFYGGGLTPDGLRQLGYRDQATALLKLMPRFYGIPEAIAYAAHHAGQPLSALGVIETLTNVGFELRMAAVISPLIEQRKAEGILGHAEVEEYIERLDEITQTAPPPAGTRMNSAAIRGLQESWLTQEMTLPPRSDPLEQFFLTTPRAHALRAAVSANRSLVYVLTGPGDHGGVAIRLVPDSKSGPLADSTYLPALQTSAVTARLDEMQARFQRAITRRRQLELTGPIRSLLDWTGASVWRGMLDAWPDLLSAPLVVVPIGNAALLPLYTASVNGLPVCAQGDLTFAPSARSLHFAAALPAASAPGPVAAVADPWHGKNRLPNVDKEARAVAAVHGVDATIYGSQASSPGRSDSAVRTFRGSLPTSQSGATQELRDLLGQASIVHLACHGTAVGPALLVGGNMVPLPELAGGDDADITSTFRGRPVVILSACQVGGFITEEIPGEHFGFPAGLLAMGARSVVGALWPVPDSDETISFMEDFHQRLLGKPSSAALAEAILAADRREAPPAVWGSFIHFGL